MRVGKKMRNKITYVRKLDIVLLLFVLVMFIVSIIGIFIVSNKSKSNQEKVVENAVKIQSEGNKEKFVNYIENKIEVLQGIATFPAVTSMDKAEQSELLKGRADEFGFLHLFVVDMKGEGYYIDEDIIREHNGEEFFDNISNGHVYVTEPFYGQDASFMTVCVSIFTENKQKVGTLCGAVALDSLRLILAESDTILDGDLFMVNREGVYISARDMRKVNNKQNIYDEVKSDYKLITQAFNDKVDKTGIISVDGKKYKAQVTYLKNYDWAIVQSVDREKIFDDMKYIDVLRYEALVIVIILIGAVARVTIHWRRSVRKINTDTLTGCNSRAAMEAAIEEADKLVNQDLTLIYLDLNKFKYVNDTYGHEIGDKVLCIYARSLMKIFAKIGFVGRMGGDEFMIILIDINKDKATELCEKLEEVLIEDSKELDFDYTISTSYGVATRLKGSNLSINDLMAEADEMMYKFKEEHR